MSLADLRTDYRLAALSESEVLANPIDQLHKWFGEAQQAEVAEPNAMSLATATTDGAPSVRTVLVKGVDERGFVFYTDYRSQKGRELTANPRAALCFFWQLLERQVRITGTVSRVSRAQSDEYFRSRPVGSRIGATASAQSSTLASRVALEQRVSSLETQFAGVEIPLPDYWGGFRVAPVALEFWQGRSSRLHDRILYTRCSNRWEISRLSP
ncbi:MAG: pyridoxamine 5'-phosphate oxidase [Gemmatimonadota bacterium]|nr:pyridoxamine 5'-phosphate oxidase [Gemmatimonadota bacterium]